jgi:hypothetical protein
VDPAPSGRAQRRGHGRPGGGERRRGLLPGLARPRRARRRVPRLSADHADADHVGRRDGRRRQLGGGARAGRRPPPRRQRAGAPRAGDRGSHGGRLHRRARPRRSRALPVHGRSRRGTDGRARLLRYRVRGGDRRLAVQHAGERDPRDGQHAPSRGCRRWRRGHDSEPLAGADLRVGTGAVIRHRRRRGGLRDLLRRGQPRPARLPAVRSEPRPALALEPSAPGGACSGRSSGWGRRAF